MKINTSEARRRVRALLQIDDDVDACWLFVGKVRKNGYARVTFKQESYYLHRLAYAAFVGAIPAGMDVCHRCDVRRCARPAHLFVGTRRDNMRDAVAKGRISRGLRHSLRVPRGERNHNAKLDWEQVREIRRRRAAGERPAVLAAAYKVDVSNINLIVRNATWKPTFVQGL